MVSVSSNSIDLVSLAHAASQSQSQIPSLPLSREISALQFTAVIDIQRHRRRIISLRKRVGITGANINSGTHNLSPLHRHPTLPVISIIINRTSQCPSHSTPRSAQSKLKCFATPLHAHPSISLPYALPDTTTTRYSIEI